jgi:DNA adenine methylase
MPPHDVYIEPFLGGGALMRHKRPAAVNIGIDLDEGPISVVRSLIARPAAALKLAMLASRAEPVKSERRRRTPPKPASAAAAGELATSNDASSRFDFHHGDGIDFLGRYPFTGRELVYADPPYLHSTRSGRMLYQHEMNDGQHRELLRVLKSLNCRVMISGYSSPLYAKELKSWHAASFQTTNRGGKAVAEWVWYNFDRPVELHDYRFLGEDFREREQIKRQKARWVERLRKMPAVRRQALLSAIADTA